MPIVIARQAVTLPGYPYALPADAARLQTDLRAAGYTGAAVTSTSAPLVATIRNHTDEGTQTLLVTMSGTSVSAVRQYSSTTIPLPGYPYAMPSQQAALQADLRTAGFTGAVVKLRADTWSIHLPDRAAVGAVRDFVLTIDPGDPYPYWDMFKTYQGLNPDNLVTGSFHNVRDPNGDPLNEAGKAFARVGFIVG